MDDFRKIGERVNLFDLTQSTIMAYIFLASKKYNSENPDSINDAITEWNNRLGKEEM